MSDEERAKWCGMDVDEYRKMINKAQLLFLKRQQNKIARMSNIELNNIRKIELILK